MLGLSGRSRGHRVVVVIVTVMTAARCWRWPKGRRRGHCDHRQYC